MQSSYANGGATNTKVTQPLRLNVVFLQGKRENTMHYILDGLGSGRNVYAPVVDIVCHLVASQTEHIYFLIVIKSP
jgi:hypothetical protein